MKAPSAEEVELIAIGNSVIQKCDEFIELWNQSILDDVSPRWRKECLRRDATE